MSIFISTSLANRFKGFNLNVNYLFGGKDRNYF